MKKRYIPLLIIACFLLIWIGWILHVNWLTASHGEEFTDFAAIGFDFMHPWDGEPELRILSYADDEATVYYFSETGGEKALFIKRGKTWQYEEILAIWSGTGGSADDYFIWPYYKNFVP